MDGLEPKIKEVVSNLFAKAGFGLNGLEVEKTGSAEVQDLYMVKLVSGEDQNAILGKGGENLKALEHLSRLILAKEAGKKVNLVLDLDNFREKRNGKILELARLVAEKVRSSGRAYVLNPMSAYERRIIHMELAAWADISTESVGEEPKRRVVIKPLI